MTRKRHASDEAYILNLCDSALGLKSLRQHRFDFLLGDPGKGGRRAKLPVDAYYPELKLIVEYYEKQHTSAVGIFDNKPTVSGISRGEQRRLYDERRRIELPKHGFEVLHFDYSEFLHKSNKTLRRVQDDRDVVAAKLAVFTSD